MPDQAASWHDATPGSDAIGETSANPRTGARSRLPLRPARALRDRPLRWTAATRLNSLVLLSRGYEQESRGSHGHPGADPPEQGPRVWPVVAEEQRDDGSPPVLTEGAAAPRAPRRLDALARGSLATPTAMARCSARPYLSGAVGRAFERARARSGDRLRVLLRVEAPDLKALRWERLAAPQRRRLGPAGPRPAHALLASTCPARSIASSRPSAPTTCAPSSSRPAQTGLEEYRLAPFDVAGRRRRRAQPVWARSRARCWPTTDGSGRTADPGRALRPDHRRAGSPCSTSSATAPSATQGETVLYLAKADGPSTR